MNEYMRIACDTDGWMTAQELAYLYRLSKESIGLIIEVGSYKGRSTIALAGGSKDGPGFKVIAIDPCFGQTFRDGDPRQERPDPQVYHILATNITRAGVSDYVDIVQGHSADVAARFDRAVGFVFIDGFHDFGSVSANFLDWNEKLLPNGTIAFHDYLCDAHPEVSAFVESEPLLQTLYAKTGVVDSIVSFRRVC